MAFLTPTTLSQQSNPSQQSDTAKIYDQTHIFDPIHGYIEIPDRIKTIIDTPQFQRLRNLKQLGASYFVFPGASHNRFEHSIGVMHLSNKLIKQIKTRQPELCITDDEIFCVTAAGLLHDLGHGPFSHVFDHEFIPSVSAITAHEDIKFTHEDMSVALIADLFKTNNIEINDEHLELIQALVSPSTHEAVYNQYKSKKRGFLFEIVANDSTGIDVDKWDYFVRDSRNTGIGISFKYDRLMEHARVIDDMICWQEKTSFELYTMFRTRYELFKRVYSHKASKSIEYMICDILRYANESLDIIAKTKDPHSFLQLTDHILSIIEFAPIIEGKKGMKGLLKAKQLIRRLQKRELYKCCGYLLLSAEIVATFNPPNTSNDTIHINEKKEDGNVNHPKIAYHAIERKWCADLYEMFKHNYNNKDKENMTMTEREELKANDLKVQLMSISFGKETVHPMEKAFLYNSKHPNVCKQVHCNQISFISGNFREVVVRAYVKKSEWKLECEQVFKQFVQRKGLVQDEDYDDDDRASKYISPKQRKSKSRRNVRDNIDILTTVTPPTINDNSRKRTRSSSTSQFSQSKSIDFMDTTQRNKKPRYNNS